MLRFAADENFNGRALRGLLRALPRLDIVRIQDSAVAGAGDPAVLAWCAEEERVLLTHDVATLTAAAYARVRAGENLPGVVEVQLRHGIGRVIEELRFLAEAGTAEDCRDQVLYLPG